MTTEPVHSGGRGRTAGTPQAIVLLLGTCMPVIGIMVISPVLPQIIRGFDDVAGVDVLAPLALTAPALSMAVLGPLAGRFVDRLGRLRLLYGALALYAVVGTAPLWLNSLYAILASRVLLGAAEAVIVTCCLTLIGDYYDGRVRDRWMAVHTPVTAVSAVLFLVLAGALGSTGWRTPFWLYTVAAVVLVAMLPLLWEPVAQTQGRPQQRPLEPMPWRRLVPPLSLTLLSAVVFYTVIVQQSIVLDAVGVDSAGIGVSAAIANVGMIVGSAAFAWLARTGASRLLVVGLLLAAAGLVVMSLGTAAVGITIGALLATIGGGLLLPSLLIGTTSALGYAQRGRGTAAWNSTFWIGQFVSPPVVVAFTSATGSLSHALQVMAVLGLIVAGIAAAVTLRHPLHTSAEVLGRVSRHADEAAESAA